MAILRAGPWGRFGSRHENEPAVIDGNTDIYPVNCAKGDWPNQAWAAVYSLDISFGYEDPYEYGLVSLWEEKTVIAGGEYAFDNAINFAFCYQATEAFTINFNWAFTGSAAAYNYPYLTWMYSLIDGPSGSYSNTPSNSGTEIITLPATTFGVVYAAVYSYDTGASGGLTLTSSLSDPSPAP